MFKAALWLINVAMKNDYNFFNLFKNNDFISIFYDCDDVIDDIENWKNKLKLKSTIFIKSSFNDIKFRILNLSFINIKESLNKTSNAWFAAKIDNLKI